MLIGGLWHGAAFTFVLWGALHGAYLIVHNVCRNAGLTPSSVALNRTVTFIAVVAAFVIFRAPNLTGAGDVLASMTGLRGLGTANVGAGLLAGIAGLVAFVNLAPNTWKIRLAWRPAYRLALGIAVAAAILMISDPTPFLYFRFWGAAGRRTPASARGSGRPMCSRPLVGTGRP